MQNHIIVFDGVCNLCNGAVNFVIDHDPNPKFHFYFASLQSNFGQQLLQTHHLDTKQFNSFLLYSNGKLYQKSTAALRVAKILGGWWQVLYAFIIVPHFIRNFIYDLIARNRYRWFGKTESCRMPTPELKSRFLD